MNAYFPHFLAKITEGTKTQVIHMSTDCVFSGKIGGYTEVIKIIQSYTGIIDKMVWRKNLFQ